MTLLPMAAIGEILGYRRSFTIGLAVFVSASATCTFASGLTMLALSRFVQGLGAAAILSSYGALVRHTYPHARLGRALGINALVIASVASSSPSIAAAVLALGSWRWLFAVNIPVGLMAICIGFANLPQGRGATTRFDTPSAVLIMLSFGALFLVASEVAHGTMQWQTALAAIVAAGLLLTVIHRSRTLPTPMLPVDLFRIRILRLSYATSAASFAGQSLVLVSLPFYLQYGLGLDGVAAGFLITPFPLGIAIGAPLAGRVERVSAGILGMTGLCVFGTSAISLALLAPLVNKSAVAVVIGLGGIGFGMFQTPNNKTMLGAAPVTRSGAAAGMLATARLAGQSSGALIAATVFRVAGPASSMGLLVAGTLALGAAVISSRRSRELPYANSGSAGAE
jgi:DHA2 family multidrug resistance protein-like MFS transporter